MTKYEELLENISQEIVSVYETYDLSNTRLKGLYYEGTVALNRELKTQAEKADVLAEELGHYHTTVGNILDQTNAEVRKQERTARLPGI